MFISMVVDSGSGPNSQLASAVLISISTHHLPIFCIYYSLNILLTTEHRKKRRSIGIQNLKIREKNSINSWN